MCRAEALEGSEAAADFRAAGARRIVALVKEDLGTEVEDFKKGWWKEEVYHDEKWAYYTAMGGGKEHRPCKSVWSFFRKLMSRKSVLKANLARAKGVQQNIKGEGFVAGGVYVLGRNGVPTLIHREEELGNRVRIQDVIDAVKAAVPAYGARGTTKPSDGKSRE